MSTEESTRASADASITTRVSTLAVKSLLFSLDDFRICDATGDVGNIVANGGLFASDTDPILRGDAAHSQEISWAAGSVVRIRAQLALPADFNGTVDVTADVTVYTDNAGGGGTDAATFTVETSWDGTAIVTDTATDGVPATSHHTNTATVANADIPDSPRYLTVFLTPVAHVNDPVQLVAIRINYASTA